jgi:hypothetical protein
MKDTEKAKQLYEEMQKSFKTNQEAALKAAKERKAEAEKEKNAKGKELEQLTRKMNNHKKWCIAGAAAASSKLSSLTDEELPVNLDTGDVLDLSTIERDGKNTTTYPRFQVGWKFVDDAIEGAKVNS